MSPNLSIFQTEHSRLGTKINWNSIRNEEFSICIYLSIHPSIHCRTYLFAQSQSQMFTSIQPSVHSILLYKVRHLWKLLLLRRLMASSSHHTIYRRLKAASHQSIFCANGMTKWATGIKPPATRWWWWFRFCHLFGIVQFCLFVSVCHNYIENHSSELMNPCQTNANNESRQLICNWQTVKLKSKDVHRLCSEF